MRVRQSGGFLDMAVWRGGDHAGAGGELVRVAQGRRAAGADVRRGFGDGAVAGEHTAAVFFIARRAWTTAGGGRWLAIPASFGRG
jgi:hypothetical protein